MAEDFIIAPSGQNANLCIQIIQLNVQKIVIDIILAKKELVRR